MIHKTLHLNFCELSQATQKELKQKIRDNYYITHNKKQLSESSITELFNINNAGIDIDAFTFML